ncbi:MAG: hypothetical protein NZ518_06170, partial [Dehalococcoidia bacterium]|nr:hypothetical protein [Dehalococcoidia bacterium]
MIGAASAGRNARRRTRSGSGLVAGEVALGVITLHNTGSAAVQPRARFGMAWTRTRFPGTHRIRARVQGGAEVAFAALVSRNRWTDGSIKTTADGGVVIHDTDPLGAGQSRTYELFATAGAQGSSGFDPWAWITAHANDFTVEVTNRTGSQTGAMGNLTFSLKTAIGTATRREIVADTPRFVRVKAWQMASGEDHLVCEFHVDFWLDGSATPLAVEWCPVLSQHWWVADPFGTGQPKQRQNYDATVRYGTTALDTRTGLQHAYHCRWASLRSANDPQHA